MKTIKHHPASNIFPLMTGPDFDELVEDIREHGQREPILVYKGMIVDGRNRFLACQKLGIEPICRELDGTGSLIDLVISMNLHRRHLTSSQRAIAAEKMLDYYAKLAKRRRATHKAGDVYLGQRIDQAKKLRGPRAAEEAARKFDTNRLYITIARHLAEKAPDLHEQVEKKKITIPQAKRELNKRERQNVPPLPSGKYRTLYCDPPWMYNDTRIGMSAYSSAEDHYPTLALNEICAMGEKIRDITERDAVMFMWVTSPILEDSFKVIRAWGFRYKSSFVWDKQDHNYGHYNSMRHELLLVCTKGSCTPDSPKLHDSVISIKRSKVHSEKPEYFRKLIEQMYTHGARLELFARKETPGWTCWGNEATQAGVLPLPDAPLTHSLPSGGRGRGGR
jgi:N6-adenosine-specific RNA methylase IME4/ParB-like chromosome segregation protein Spo0J